MTVTSTQPGKLPPIQFYVIGGYLGAGKTTLLNHLLRQPGLTSTAVLVNDFGKINIDAELIENTDGETYRLENGCICCNIGQAFFTTLLQVVKSSPPPARIIVEASGVADPSRIADIARLSPSMQLQKVVVVADCAKLREYAADPQVDSMVIQQIKCADILLLNKYDLIDEVGLKELGDWIRDINPRAELMPCVQAEVPLTKIFDLNATINEMENQPAMTDEIDLDVVEDRHRLNNWIVELPGAVERAALSKAIRSLPMAIHRVKGFVSFEGYEGWFLVQYTPGQLDITEVGSEPSTELRGQLVFVGTRQQPHADEFLRLIANS
ncbi:MAG: GTP-binding protein [Gammaproteobacteria bacterium]|nr:GTP-binding protein [Gammaproteobacteria bacterium]